MGVAWIILPSICKCAVSSWKLCCYYTNYTNNGFYCLHDGFSFFFFIIFFNNIAVHCVSVHNVLKWKRGFLDLLCLSKRQTFSNVNIKIVPGPKKKKSQTRKYLLSKYLGIVMTLVQTLNGGQGAVAHEGRTQRAAKATCSQTEQGPPGYTDKMKIM